MDDDSYKETRRMAHEALHALREQYEKAAAPYIKILVDLESITPRSIAISRADYERLITTDSGTGSKK